MNIPRKKRLLVLGTNYIIIHEDVLLSNIFIRLPAKQLAQMRSLSKTWNSLLSHPSFINSHLEHSKETNDEILLVFKDSFLCKDEPFTAHTTPDLQLTNSVKANMDNSLEGYVVGAVNGLICLSTDDERCTIWNPSLSASIDLPPWTIGLDHDIRPYKCFRFGFDHKTNDYKVVKLTFNYRKEWFPVEVFRVSKGSWETITERFPTSHVELVLNTSDFVVDGYAGRLHYLCKVNSAQQTIVSFDLGDETFREIALPDSLPVGGKELGVLSQKLCLLSADRDVGCCEVWVMENYGVATSWVKRHVISQYKGDGVYPVVFTSKNQFVLGHMEHLSMYDPEDSAFTEFKGGAPVSVTATVVQYVDSLVWVTPTKWACNDVFKSSSQSENKPHLDYEEQGVTRPKSARERRKMPKKRHEHRSKRRSPKK